MHSKTTRVKHNNILRSEVSSAQLVVDFDMEWLIFIIKIRRSFLSEIISFICPFNSK
jgi:hypothetical protein